MAAVLTPVRPRPARIPSDRPHLRLVPNEPVEREAPPWRTIAVACLALATLLGIYALVSARGGLADLAAEQPAAVAPVGARTVTVRAGDTLWSIARSIQPTGDLRPLVDRLIALNGDAVLRPGQQVVLPS